MSLIEREYIMQHKCKVTVIDKKVFVDYQEKYLADPRSGACPFYNIGDEFIFERYAINDTFWRMGSGSQCAEAWDCISRYIYTALQGGSIMRGWTNDDRMMIACCNDGTRPVIFKIERLDYKAVNFDRAPSATQKAEIIEKVKFLGKVTAAEFNKEGFLEVYLEADIPDKTLVAIIESCDGVNVTRVD